MDPANNGRAAGVERGRWPFAPKTAEEASQGEKSGRMRWVLGSSITLIVASFAALYFYTVVFTAHQ